MLFTECHMGPEAFTLGKKKRKKDPLLLAGDPLQTPTPLPSGQFGHCNSASSSVTLSPEVSGELEQCWLGLRWMLVGRVRLGWG